MAELDVARFYDRLGNLHSHFAKHRSGPIWGDASCLCLLRGKLNENEPYLKSVVLHHYLFGYELPDTILLLTHEGHCYILTAKKKCEFLETAVRKAPPGSPILGLTILERNKADGNAENFAKLLKAMTASENGDTHRVGMLMKERAMNKESEGMLGAWEQRLDDESSMELVDVTAGVSFAMSVKDETELDLIKKSSVLSNKVMKHGCIPRMEEIIDSELKVSQEKLSGEFDAMIEDPSKIKLKVDKEDVQSCYFPVVQSGGEYDIRLSAQSTSERLKYDIITISLGARYKLYCSNIARTFLVDPPKRVADTYETLLSMQDECLKEMAPGKPLKGVYKAAVNYLRSSDNEELISKLPKTLGFSIGLDFRDPTLVLSAKNPATFRPGMVFSLVLGFSPVDLPDDAKASTNSKSAVKAVSNYALLLSDMVAISKDGSDLLTKLNKSLADISYTINDEEEGEDDEEESSDDDVEVPDAPEGDEAYARRVSKEVSGRQRSSARLAKDAGAAQEAQEGVAERERAQIALMVRRNEERLRELARANSRNKGSGGESQKAEELEAYTRTTDYPDNVQPNQVKVDMANQSVILPICGNPVPFHISTIKNVVLPDPDNATYLRINFYSAGLAVGKDAPVNMAKLVEKYAPYVSFIREMTFRSLDSHNLTQAYRQIMELRKRARAKELREQEEANLVEQEKLARTKNERVPRLSDLTMRPVFAGRKTQGNLEAHSNGLRFISTRGEVVDIMYSNIKYAIYQPCESEIMVLIHFHLKNPIMVGKKKQRDIQFFTEVVDASQTVDGGRRSMYDPDEMDDEQRERQLRKRLNQAFKDFCKKVDAVAKKNNYNVEFDIPYRDLGFVGNPHKEMVTIQPTLNCLVNLTETPFFVVDLADVDHVHFERVTYMSKAFDIVLINKDFSKQPWRIDMIPNEDKDAIQDWLTDMEITYTQGPMNLNWKQIMQTINGDDRFYMNTEEDEVTEKEAGWEFLRLYGKDDDDEEEDEEDDSEFSGAEEEEEEQLEEDEEESEFDSEPDDESDFDADEDLEEQGMDWEDMEREAAADDRRKRQNGEEVVEDRRGATKKQRRR